MDQSKTCWEFWMRNIPTYEQSDKNQLPDYHLGFRVNRL